MKQGLNNLKYITIIARTIIDKKGKVVCLAQDDNFCVIEFSPAPKNKYYKMAKEIAKTGRMKITIEAI